MTFFIRGDFHQFTIKQTSLAPPSIYKGSGKSILLRLFFVFLFFFTSLNIGTPILSSEERSTASICNIEFELPLNSKTIKDTDDLILFIQKASVKTKKNNRIQIKNTEIQWLLTCNRNIRKTSQVGEFVEYYKSKNESIRSYKEFILAGHIQAASFNRYRIKSGRKLYTHTTYFATRNYEYNLHLIPHDTHSLKEAVSILENSILKENKKEFLHSLRFLNLPQATITESHYRWRFRALLLGMVVFIFLIILLFFRNNNVKKKRKAT